MKIGLLSMLLALAVTSVSAMEVTRPHELESSREAKSSRLERKQLKKNPRSHHVEKHKSSSVPRV